MENNQGFVIFNTSLKNYYSVDGHFVNRIADAKIYNDEGVCNGAIRKLSSSYKEVPTFEEKNFEMKKISVHII